MEPKWNRKTTLWSRDSHEVCREGDTVCISLAAKLSRYDENGDLIFGGDVYGRVKELGEAILSFEPDPEEDRNGGKSIGEKTIRYADIDDIYKVADAGKDTNPGFHGWDIPEPAVNCKDDMEQFGF